MIERMSRRSTWEERSRNQKESRSDATTEVEKKNGKRVEEMELEMKKRNKNNKIWGYKSGLIPLLNRNW